MGKRTSTTTVFVYVVCPWCDRKIFRKRGTRYGFRMVPPHTLGERECKGTNTFGKVIRQKAPDVFFEFATKGKGRKNVI
jgi:hypothetical protein